MKFEGIYTPVITPHHDDGSIDREAFVQTGLCSAAVIPLGAARSREGTRRSMVCGSVRERDWPAAVTQQLRLTAGIFSQALLRKASQAQLQQFGFF